MSTTILPISVVMTTYNGASFLEKQLNSIFQQTLLPKELIICDDCSSDDTMLIIKKISTQFQINYSQNKKKLGIVANFKQAVLKAKKENYIALADQDDIWLPTKLEKLSIAMQRIEKQPSNPAMIYSDLAIINASDELINPSFWHAWEFDQFHHCFQTLLFGNFVTGCTLLMNPVLRDHFTEMPDDTTMHDAWIALVAFALGNSIAITEALVHYRKHDNNAAFTRSLVQNKGMGKLYAITKKIINNDPFLQDRIPIIISFRKKYEALLQPDQLAMIDRFLDVTTKHYLHRKIFYQKVFGDYRNV